MNFPATDIEYSMQDEIDRPKARIEELEIAAGLCNNANEEQYARIAALEAERARLREALEAIDKVWDRDENISDTVHYIARAALDGGKP